MGVGLLATQVQESPPSEPGTAPVGRVSSTQMTALLMVPVPVPGVLVVPPLGGGVFVPPLLGSVTVLPAAIVPAKSHVVRPSNWLKAMPLTVLPSSATRLAGT